MDLETKIIRAIWALVETSNPYLLIRLSDREIIQKLIYELEKIVLITHEDRAIMTQYIASKLILIRDLAYSKVD